MTVRSRSAWVCFLILSLSGLASSGCLAASRPTESQWQMTNEPAVLMEFATSTAEVAAIPLSTITVEETPIPTTLPNEVSPTITPLPCGDDWCLSFGHFAFQRPIGATDNDYVEPSYPFGGTVNGERDPHHGVEFMNPEGVRVLAAGDGIVVVAGTDHTISYGAGTDFYGNLVMIEHQLVNYKVPVYTLYGHLSQIFVQEGQIVKAGDIIGAVGKSGRAMGMHLHFEVRVAGMDYFDTRNPELWLAPHEGNGILVGRIINPDGETRYFPDIVVERIDENGKIKRYKPEPYGDPNLKSDEFYQEVFVIGDLPAGEYRVRFSPPGVSQVMEVEIVSGMVTQITLHARY